MSLDQHRLVHATFQTSVLPVFNTAIRELPRPGLEANYETGSPEVQLEDGSMETFITDAILTVKLLVPVREYHYTVSVLIPTDPAATPEVTIRYGGFSEDNIEVQPFPLSQLTEAYVDRSVREFLASLDIRLP